MVITVMVILVTGFPIIGFCTTTTSTGFRHDLAPGATAARYPPVRELRLALRRRVVEATLHRLFSLEVERLARRMRSART